MCSTYDEGVNSSTIRAFAPDVVFELIPPGEAADSAGYTPEDRDAAVVWYGPTLDPGGEVFYYCAWHGSLFSPDYKSTILVCRRVGDGGLVYAINTEKFNLDTGLNFFGGRQIVTRSEILVLGDTLYLVSGNITNIGAQLYAVNKVNGTLKWAAAYYPPTGAPDYITEKGDYSEFAGSNSRVGNLSTAGGYYEDKDGDKHKYIFVGSSTMQNGINFGDIQGGFPKYTDQGFMFCIEDLDSSSALVWKTATCAPEIKVGDTILKGGDPEYDPFRPASDEVVIFSVSDQEKNNFVNPYFMEASDCQIPKPGQYVPFVANVNFSKETVIDALLVQSIWMFIPDIFVGSDREKSYNLEELIVRWKELQEALPPGGKVKEVIWSYVEPSRVEQAQNGPRNDSIGYFKFLESGHTVDWEYDAEGLNYYGNSVWGARPTLEGNMIYFGSGQGHEICMDETIFYSASSRNFFELKKPMLDALNFYKDGTLSLSDFERSRSNFTDTIKTLAINVSDKSPRGRMSYSDGVLAAYIQDREIRYKGDCGEMTRYISGGDLAFAFRTVAWDNFTFLSDDPTANVYPVEATDGDVSSGILLSRRPHDKGRENCRKERKTLTTPPKGGIAPIVDLSHFSRKIKFNHSNLADTGVVVEQFFFNGPNAALGGSNYQADSNCDSAFSCQANQSWFNGAKSTNGTLEVQVAESGKIFDVNNSYMQGYSFSGDVNWETPLDNRAHGQVRLHRDIVFVGDLNRSLYAFDLGCGEIIWKYDGENDGMNGGIARPVVSEETDAVIWINNYSFFGRGQPGKNGVIFRYNHKIKIKCNDRPDYFLPGNKYESWDNSPKTSANPAINPTSDYNIKHKWVCGNKYKGGKSELIVKARHQIGEQKPEYYTFKVKKYDNSRMILTFLDADCHEDKKVEYLYIRLINKATYELKFVEIVDGAKTYRTSWLQLPRDKHRKSM